MPIRLINVVLLTIALILLAPFTGYARQVESWPYEKLMKEADLAVIAAATGSADSADRRTDLWRDTEFVGVNTSFDVQVVLKGALDGNTLKVLHYRLSDPQRLIQDGPLLVSFRTKGIELKTKSVDAFTGTPHYLLFLKHREDGRYEAVSGQIDPELSVREIYHPLPAILDRRDGSAPPATQPAEVTAVHPLSCVQDDGAFFSPAAIRQVDNIGHNMFAIASDVRIVTFAAIPENKKQEFEALGKNEFFKHWADDIAKRDEFQGIVILICKNPSHLQVIAGDEMRKKAFTDSDIRELVSKLLVAFKARKYDEGVLDAVKFIQTREAANLRDADPPAPQANVHKDEDAWNNLKGAFESGDIGKAVVKAEDYRRQHPDEPARDLDALVDEGMNRLWWNRIVELCSQRASIADQIKKKDRDIREETSPAFRKILAEEKKVYDEKLAEVVKHLAMDMDYDSPNAPALDNKEVMRKLSADRDGETFVAWKRNTLKYIRSHHGHMPWDE